MNYATIQHYLDSLQETDLITLNKNWSLNCSCASWATELNIQCVNFWIEGFNAFNRGMLSIIERIGTLYRFKWTVWASGVNKGGVIWVTYPPRILGIIPPPPLDSWGQKHSRLETWSPFSIVHYYHKEEVADLRFISLALLKTFCYGIISIKPSRSLFIFSLVQVFLHLVLKAIVA